MFLIILLILQQLSLINSQYIHDYPVDYFDQDNDQPETRSAPIDSDVYGQWTPDPDGQYLATCDNGVVLTIKRVKLPFNQIGMVIRFPSHHSIELEVKCPDKYRKLNIDYTSESEVRQRFGFFAYQFRR